MLAGARNSDRRGLENFATVFTAVVVQATPFLVLGALVSAAIATLLPAGFLAAALPRCEWLAIPVAGVASVAGVALPGCECGSVPVAARLVDSGASPAAALTFMLAAPAVNPVVLVATAVTFPGRPAVVAARLVASMATAIVAGLLWSRFGTKLARATDHDHQATGVIGFARVFQTDFVAAGGYLVIGAAMAALLQTVVPRSLLDRMGGGGPVAVGAMVTLAILLSVCSEADAFVAAGLRQFSLTARLVFLVVGPVVDLKLIAMHVGTFGRSFAVRFVPMVVVIAVTCALTTGAVVL